MSALSLDNLVQSVTKLTEDKVNLQTKLGTLSTKIEQMTNQSHALSGEEGALQKKHGELLGSSRNLQQECNAAKHQLESEKCSHLTLSSTVDALNTKKKTLDIDVAQRKAAYAADVENTSTSLQAIPDTLDNPEVLAFAGWCLANQE